MKGYFQIYTGKGKGKTTAALGLALRAAGAGKKVFIGQFMKSGGSSEEVSIKDLSRITLHTYGTGRFIKDTPSPEDIEKAQKGFAEIKEVIEKGDCGIVIMDEICNAIHYGLVDEKQVLDVIRERPPHVEIVATGRNASSRMVEEGDLVTEMKKIKHYFEKGVKARTGIEK